MFNINKEKPLKTFSLKLLFFFLFFILLDRSIGFFLEKYYNQQVAGYDYQTAFAIDKTKADIVIFGSSRAANLYNPAIFEKQMNMTCYNAGRDGHPLFYHYAVLKAILKRKIPKVVILSFDTRNFSNNQDAYDRLSTILPFYKGHPEMRSVIELKSRFEKLKMLSAIYPYNSLLLPILNGNMEKSKMKYATINGYYPLEGSMKAHQLNIDFTIEKELDTVKINTFKSFIEECRQYGVKLFIICPPYLTNSKSVDRSIITAKKIAKDYNVNFLDYSSDTFYTKKPFLFADFRHLNEAGVQIFSNDVIEKIK